jgi:UDP-N-acetylmuramoyl-tripeptide--D-alanyl-D-alanine ligase
VISLSWDEVEGLGLGRLEGDGSGAPIARIVADSRVASLGDLFVALNTGTRHVEDARSRGAATLVPDDQEAALAALASLVRSKSSARVVAVVGSAGKTSTKDILAALCSPHARTIAADKSLNNEIGLPLTVCRLEPDTELLVTEMGMRGLGQIAALCAIARPDIAVVSHVGPEHLELLGTVERVAQSKAEVVRDLEPGGTAVVPAGDPLLEPYLDRTDVDVLRFGPGGDVQLAAYTPAGDRSAAVVDAFGERLEFDLPFASRYNAENLLPAVAGYRALGLPLVDAPAGAADIRLSRWRGEELPLPGGGLLINDAYNANPLSMTAALEHLRERADGRRTVAVLGDMAELGPGGPAYHVEVGEAAAASGVAALVAVGELARNYLDGAGGVEETRWAPDAEAAIAETQAVLHPGDCVLLKASRAVGLEILADALAVEPAAH